MRRPSERSILSPKLNDSSLSLYFLPAPSSTLLQDTSNRYRLLVSGIYRSRVPLSTLKLETQGFEKRRIMGRREREREEGTVDRVVTVGRAFAFSSRKNFNREIGIGKRDVKRGEIVENPGRRTIVECPGRLPLSPVQFNRKVS